MSEDIVRDIPETENGNGVHCVTANGEHYIISQNLYKREHTLWKVVNDGYIMITTADSPNDLYPIIPWKELNMDQ